jgi:hypothetical protein
LIDEKVMNLLDKKNKMIRTNSKQMKEKDEKIKSMELESILYKESIDQKRKIIDFIMNPKDKVTCALNTKSKIKFFGNGNC